MNEKTKIICVTIVLCFLITFGSIIYLNSNPYIIGFQTDDNSALIVKELTDAMEKTDLMNRDLFYNLTECQLALSYYKIEDSYDDITYEGYMFREGMSNKEKAEMVLWAETN